MKTKERDASREKITRDKGKRRIRGEELGQRY